MPGIEVPSPALLTVEVECVEVTAVVVTAPAEVYTVAHREPRVSILAARRRFVRPLALAGFGLERDDCPSGLRRAVVTRSGED